MTGTVSIRQELHTFIDAIPEKRLSALKPLLFDMAFVDEPLIIESDLTDEEHSLIEDSVNRFHEHPETFISLDSIK